MVNDFVFGVNKQNNSVNSDSDNSNGGNYTKHIYMGSQRITSKLSNSGIFTTRNPLTDTTALNKSYTAKLSGLTTKIKERFDTLGVSYKGVQQTGGLVSSSPPSGDLGGCYFYHSDHLGSSSLITDAIGALVQHVEYVPFGETFLEERNGNWHTPYLFNGKERDEETGLHYYGARYYDSRTSVWLSVDPLAEEKPFISSYVYCRNNPINMIDPDGRDEWEVNEKGYLKKIPETVSDIDKIFPIDNEGKRKEIKPFEIEKGILDNIQSHPDFETPLSPDVHKLKISDDKTAEELEVFLWNNTKVEFSLINTSVTNYITTSHEEGHEHGWGRAFNRGFIKGKIDKHTHNHPGNSKNPSPGDIKTKENAQASDKNKKNKIFENTIFQIYTKEIKDDTNYHNY